MSAIKRSMKMSVEVLETIRSEVTKMLLHKVLRTDFIVGEFALKAPTVINSRTAVEFYDGEESNIDWDSIPDWFDGVNLASFIEYLQKQNLRFARILRTRTIIVANEYDEVTVLHYDSNGIIVGCSETYEDRFLDAVHELE